MSGEITKPSDNRPPTPAEFRAQATGLATGLLQDWVGADRAQEAAGRIATAISCSAAAAKKPQEFYGCSPKSIATCIAVSALTGIMPGVGAHALAYLIPRKVKNVQTLNYQLSHRGLNALAKRCGQQMTPIPVGYDDTLDIDPASGDCLITDMDWDDPPLSHEELRGIVLIVKDLNSGNVAASKFVAKKVIDARREQSDSWRYAEKSGEQWAKDSSPWHKWPVEQAMKTAMHYAVSRGWCVIDDTEAVRALSTDAESDLREVPAVDVSAMLEAAGGPETIFEEAQDTTDKLKERAKKRRNRKSKLFYEIRRQLEQAGEDRDKVMEIAAELAEAELRDDAEYKELEGIVNAQIKAIDAATPDEQEAAPSQLFDGDGSPV
jgi:recombinational DNA repair protein RecT